MKPNTLSRFASMSALLVFTGSLAVWPGIGPASKTSSQAPSGPLAPVGRPATPDAYNIVWDTPSKDALGSMPLGNGDIGLNVWVEARATSSSISARPTPGTTTTGWSRSGASASPCGPTPSPARASGRSFAFTRARSSSTGRSRASRSRPASGLRRTTRSSTSRRRAGAPLSATAAIELWRTERTTLPSIEVSDTWYDAPPDKAQPTVVEPDFVFPNLGSEIAWCHHNVKSVGPELSMRFQDLMEAPWKDPLLHRTFGALIRADRGRRLDDRRLEAAPAARQHISVYVLTQQPATPDVVAGLGPQDGAKSRGREPGQAPRRTPGLVGRLLGPQPHRHPRREPRRHPARRRPTAGFDVSRGYALQRFINACAGRGAYPIKFNGSIFTVGRPGKPGDADYRRWGPGYWWQNTRLPYIGSCASGDFDLMQPLFRMYAGEICGSPSTAPAATSAIPAPTSPSASSSGAPCSCSPTAGSRRRARGQAPGHAAGTSGSGWAAWSWPG